MLTVLVYPTSPVEYDLIAWVGIDDDTAVVMIQQGSSTDPKDGQAERVAR